MINNFYVLPDVTLILIAESVSSGGLRPNGFSAITRKKYSCFVDKFWTV